MPNKDGSKPVSEYNIAEFMEHMKDQYDFNMKVEFTDTYINFLEGFCIVFPAPEKFLEIINVLREFKKLLHVVDRYSK